MTMKMRTIVLTESDRLRLTRLLDITEARAGERPDYLAALRRELDRARIVAPEEVPGNVITMNSAVRLRDLITGEAVQYTLVYPERADISEGRLSVLAPVGTAIIGHREGDVIEWAVPAGLRRLEVEQVVYQPERAGEYGQ